MGFTLCALILDEKIFLTNQIKKLHGNEIVLKLKAMEKEILPVIVLGAFITVSKRVGVAPPHLLFRSDGIVFVVVLGNRQQRRPPISLFREPPHLGTAATPVRRRRRRPSHKRRPFPLVESTRVSDPRFRREHGGAEAATGDEFEEPHS